MRHSNRILGTAALIAGSTISAFAGNIPQYEFRQTNTEFKFLEGATPVRVTRLEEGANQLYFLEDRAYINAYNGQGYPIGFDFKYAGNIFNQFAIDCNGGIILGKDRINSMGYLSLMFKDPSIYPSNSFCIGMLPFKGGIDQGDISYKTEGTEGNRTLTVEYAHMRIMANTLRQFAIYSMQIVLHEDSGKVDINFLEENTPSEGTGFHCGLSGVDYKDQILLTSGGLGDPFTVSADRQADMLNGNTVISWRNDDELGYDHMDPYSYTLSFTPTGEKGFTCSAPQDLAFDQEGDVITVSCKRPADADATMILWSKSPITDADLPEEGRSYLVKDQNKEWASVIGNSTVVYYYDDEIATAKIENVSPATKYYVKAFGVNGYPSYSVESAADLEVYSSHPAPTLFRATSADNAIDLQTVAADGDKVIIAVTDKRLDTSIDAPVGVFGTPEADSKVGDAIEGGGEVIYVGDYGTFSYKDATPNRQLYFRTWAIRDGRVSKTSNNTAGVTNPSFPFKPEVECWALYQAPMGWMSNTTNNDEATVTRFVPRLHGEVMDIPAIAGISAMGTTSSLITPSVNVPGGSTLEFEWAMETTREPVKGDDELVVLPEGNEPGKFGMGHSFKVTCGGRGTGTDLYESSEYKGTMTENPLEPGRYVSGTSTFIPVKVDMPAADNTRVQFAFSTEGYSILYLRNIVIDNGGMGGVGNIDDALDANDIFTSGAGLMSILSAKGGEYAVYSLDGIMVKTVTLGAGEAAVIALERGVYMVSGHKILVK